MRNKNTIKRPAGIPHLELFGQLSELRQYRVKNILAGKLILAEHVKTCDLVIFKTLHKSPAVYRKSKTSLLPINIKYMVRLLKYFETDDCVHLMLEHCSTGVLWDVVQPLICQTSRNINETTSINTSETRVKSPVQRQTSIIKPSESFIQERKISINLTKSDSRLSCDDASDNDDDLMIVHKTNPDSVVVVNSNKIEHFQNINDNDPEDSGLRLKCDSKIVENSQSMLKEISKKIDQNDSGVKNVIDKLENIESKIKHQLSGDGDAELTSSIKEFQPKKRTEQGRPRVLRKLSEILPQCSSFLDEITVEMTELPDKLIRTWAAQLVTVLSSLHYREVIIRDLNPSNLLLDSNGHVKLTYQVRSHL